MNNINSAKDPIISLLDHQLIFRDIEKIYQYQVILVESLESSSINYLEDLAEIILKWLNCSINYAQYFITYRSSSSILERLMDTNGEFRSFINNKDGLSLEELLNYPLSHIPKMEYSLELIIKRLSVNNLNLGKLLNALMSVKYLFLLLATCQNRSESYSVQYELQKITGNNDLSLVKEKRKHLFKMVLQITYDKSSRLCILYLFDDCLIIVRKQKSKNQLKFVASLSLNEISIQWDSSVQSSGRNIIIRYHSDEYIISFNDESQKEKFLDSLLSLYKPSKPIPKSFDFAKDQISSVSKNPVNLEKILKPLYSRTVGINEILDAISSVKNVDHIIQKIESSENFDFSNESNTTLLTLFVEYLLRIENPVIPFSTFKSFNSNLKNGEIDNKSLHELMNNLPEMSYAILKLSIELLCKLGCVDNEEKNQSRSRTVSKDYSNILDVERKKKSSSLQLNENNDFSGKMEVVSLLGICLIRIEKENDNMYEGINFIKKIPNMIKLTKSLMINYNVHFKKVWVKGKVI